MTSWFDGAGTSCSSTSTSTSNTSLPLHIRASLEDLLGQCVGSVDATSKTTNLDRNDNDTGLSVALVQSIQPIKSAQQRVWIVEINRNLLMTTKCPLPTAQSDKALSNGSDGPASVNDASNHTITPSAVVAVWRDALQRGNHRLVVREWRGASRWWNVNHPVVDAPPVPATPPNNSTALFQNDTSIGDTSQTDCLNHIAQQEVWGYQCAHQVFDVVCRNDTNDPSKRRIRIPQLLHFQLNERIGNNDSTDDALMQQQHCYPWAVFEYVGAESTLYDHTVQPDDSWIRQMIPIRHEFGFDEPHPRWGRVSEKDCLEYALMVLRSVMLPIHGHYRRAAAMSGDDNDSYRSAAHCPRHHNAIRYADMVDLYQSKLDSCLWTTRISESDVETLPPTRAPECNNDNPLSTFLPLLKRALQRLHETKRTIVDLPGVLCHMDYQPQNLCFAKFTFRHDSAKRHECTLDIAKPSSSWITSVLDWEEAAYADPRFDLLMLCRKVCCNRQQADYLWNAYEEELGNHLLHTNGNASLTLGSIEPWLALETVHSITTLLLQAIAGGGRNSWETRTDLWNKIQREFQRLEGMGWALSSDTAAE